jgi:hypothetical protein
MLCNFSEKRQNALEQIYKYYELLIKSVKL